MLTQYLAVFQSKMIYTITLNPAIDKTIYLDSLTSEHVNRVKKSYKDAAGKGINVSKVLNSLGQDSQILTIIAGKNGEFIKSKLSVDHRFMYTDVDGETRQNMKLINEITGDVYEVNESGPVVELHHVFGLLNKARFTKNDIVVIAGSSPKGLPSDIYYQMIEILKKDGVTIVLDSSNDLLVEGAKAKPSLIKPNKDELEAIFNKKYESVEDILKDKERILSLGAETVIVSLGKEGSLYISNKHIYLVDGIKVDALSTVGAGDSFVSGFVFGLANKMHITNCLKWATAVATASVTTVSTQPGELSRVKEIFKKVVVKELET